MNDSEESLPTRGEPVFAEHGQSRGVNSEQNSHLLAAGSWSTYGANIDRQVLWFIVASAWRKNKLVTSKGNSLSERTALSGVELCLPAITNTLSGRFELPRFHINVSLFRVY